ncbi:MAG TPA: DUF1326 domain-containing protein [Nitrososphaeraceae archaeon]|jgi:hypothetical protein
MSSSGNLQEELSISKWNIKADYVETCNCDFGCPCNFDGFPTYGFCRALVFFHIKKGNFGSVQLDGLDVVYAVSWPKAIHEGSGTLQLFITKHSDQSQRNAIVNIFTGKARGDGPFALFSTTFKYILDSQFVEISSKIDGTKSSFSVPGILDVQLESFVNPVTGDLQQTKIQLPKGFIWKIADAAKTKVMKVLTPNLNFDHSGKNAFYSVVEFNGP